ncbi:hypothetical protein GJA_2274 [Janthinobacterium agaricidamnosum NBRC 102515 = DSM 9628]|uniref:Uncharacterized protein n=1 Tax=Janthinobacterium agaricidamnosum NBRC 102515 = DSM 9628 TaxID=1349767 RepID=W0V6D2_9BURK|nr:hypothetical protein GJA_2274 [Janthinobacterium agaricidamnosum NBRC 102515 = DSM 9628]
MRALHRHGQAFRTQRDDGGRRRRIWRGRTRLLRRGGRTQRRRRRPAWNGRDSGAHGRTSLSDENGRNR